MKPNKNSKSHNANPLINSRKIHAPKVLNVHINEIYKKLSTIK